MSAVGLVGFLHIVTQRSRLSKLKNQYFHRQPLYFLQMLTELHSFTASGTLVPSLKRNLGLKGYYIETVVYPVELVKMFPSECFFHQKMVAGWNPSAPQPDFGDVHMFLENTRMLPVSLMTVSQL